MKKDNRNKKRKRGDTTEKSTGDEKPELEKRYQEIIEQAKEKAETADKEVSKAMEKPPKQKKQQHKQIVR